ASGKDDVLIETVGVGQAEIDIVDHADTVVLALMPGSGDSIQALKAGVMEIPDIIVINKKDHPRAMATARDIQSFLNLSEEEDRPWAPPVLLTDAVSGEGVQELWEAIQDHGRWLGEEGRLERRRQSNVEAEVATLAANRLQSKIRQMMRDDPRVSQLLTEVHEGRLDPFSVVEHLIASFGGPVAGGAHDSPGPTPSPDVG
ncbi:MAG TPA: methylmalonyl Co-A mutase-associated GTPase MeaB, partial [Thermoleophilia bacterium]|nr:methylmalonyl Co-A mutase-associated GTPase MeaB [Thermoleophilia bacterium]